MIIFLTKFNNVQTTKWYDKKWQLRRFREDIVTYYIYKIMINTTPVQNWHRKKKQITIQQPNLKKNTDNNSVVNTFCCSGSQPMLSSVFWVFCRWSAVSSTDNQHLLFIIDVSLLVSMYIYLRWICNHCRRNDGNIFNFFNCI